MGLVGEMSRPRALDLFCGAGGVSVGLARAGFEVVGVDLNPKLEKSWRKGMEPYGGEFHEADALTFPLDGFDFIWASPPCQAYSSLRFLSPDKTYPDLVAPIRARLAESGALAAIENVLGAPLIAPILLCGSMFDGLRVRRHRLFELNFWALTPRCNHARWQFDLPVSKSNYRRGRKKSSVVGVYGGTQNNQPDSVRMEAMGIDWMSRKELTQAIPPAYAQWIGGRAMEALAAR